MDDLIVTSKGGSWAISSSEIPECDRKNYVITIRTHLRIGRNFSILCGELNEDTCRLVGYILDHESIIINSQECRIFDAEIEVCRKSRFYLRFPAAVTNDRNCEYFNYMIETSY